MQIRRAIEPSTRYNRNNSIRSQRMINALLKAKRDNPEITEQELRYVAFGYREAGRA